MFSPTGYYAHVHLFVWDTNKKCSRPAQGVLPVLHWNADGHPVISNEGGNLVTPQQYADKLAAEWGEDDPEVSRTLGTFEIQPFGDDK